MILFHKYDVLKHISWKHLVNLKFQNVSLILEGIKLNSLIKPNNNGMVLGPLKLYSLSGLNPMGPCGVVS